MVDLSCFLQWLNSPQYQALEVVGHTTRQYSFNFIVTRQLKQSLQSAASLHRHLGLEGHCVARHY